MKTFSLWITLCFIFFAVVAYGQNKQHKKTPLKFSKNKISKKISRTISMGVINSRAIDLVRPEYPKSARFSNVYGQVSVQVLIDENGEVISAKSISGHPVLKSVSVNAALNSKFAPITLSGEPVRVNGIINYNFIPNRWNWLEIGFAVNNFRSGYYLTKILTETLPINFEEERQLVQQLFQNPENDSEIKNAIIASIKGKLVEDEKAGWLFSVGLILGQISRNCCQTDEEKSSIEELKILLQTKPENISIALISNIEKLISLAENPKFNFLKTMENKKFYQILKDLEQKFPYYD